MPAPRFAMIQLGARRHYAVARILSKAGMLERLFTDIYSGIGFLRLLGTVPRRFQPNAIRRIMGRQPADVPSRLVTAFNCFGFEYACRLRRARTTTDQTSAFLWAGQEICRKVRAHGLSDATAVYCFNSAGLEILEDARRENRFSVIEQTIAPKRIEMELLRKEKQRWPDWEQQSQHDIRVPEYIDREESEWALADRIICGSTFVRDGIALCGGPVDKCVVVPYGVHIARANHPKRPFYNSNRKLRVLSIGAIGLRKGSPYVLHAAKQLRRIAEFRMVGPIQVMPKVEAELRKHLDLSDSVPRNEVDKYYDWADIFLLPSVCEGSAIVTYEAISRGIPVVCTPNSGSMIVDGVDGFIVPFGDTDSLCRRIEQIARGTDLLISMQSEARKSKSRTSLVAYGERLVSALQR